MPETAYKTALIVGAGSGLSASLARLFAKTGLKVALAARRAANLATLAQETGATVSGPLYSDALSKPDGPAPDYISMLRYNTSWFVRAMRAG